MQKKWVQITLIMLIITVILIIMVIRIYAGYAGIVGKASDTAYIARWDVSMNKIDNLFEHSYILNLTNQDENGNYIIAPGTSGQTDIILNNNGDVKAKITEIVIRKTDESVTVPLIFSIDNKKTWISLNDVNIQLEPYIINIGESKKVATLYWEWPSEGNDVLDTLVGMASAKGDNKFTLKVNVKAEQLIED